MDLGNYEQVIATTPNATSIAISLTESGFYLAFVANSSSACVEITRVTVLYRQCPETVNLLVRYGRTPIGGMVSGQCVNGSSQLNVMDLNVMCTPDGFELSSAGSCECIAGYTAANETTCTRKFVS